MADTSAVGERDGESVPSDTDTPPVGDAVFVSMRLGVLEHDEVSEEEGVSENVGVPVAGLAVSWPVADVVAVTSGVAVRVNVADCVSEGVAFDLLPVAVLSNVRDRVEVSVLLNVMSKLCVSVGVGGVGVTFSVFDCVQVSAAVNVGLTVSVVLKVQELVRVELLVAVAKCEGVFDGLASDFVVCDGDDVLVLLLVSEKLRVTCPVKENVRVVLLETVSVLVLVRLVS